MTQTPEDWLRQVLEDEGGCPVSAGARVAHVRAAVDAGRAYLVDLSGVPEDRRPALVAAIDELVSTVTRGPRPGLAG